MRERDDATPLGEGGGDLLRPPPGSAAASRHDHELDALSEDELRARIDGLVEHRERCLQRADHQGSSRADIELDQLWDLLRQRRARRAAGADPAAVHLRPAAVVERYEQ